MSKRGFLVISLDFELLWGIFDVVNYKKKAGYFESTINSIPEVLKLFQEQDIHCTWATVGMLFLNNWEEWKEQKPLLQPTYLNPSLSPYNFIDKLKEPVPPEYCFAPELIKTITKVPHQEIATHTYSHFYCKEKGQTLDQFEEDLKKAIKSAERLGISLKTLVFPRNQINFQYLKICKKYGINSVRSNPMAWYWNNPQSRSLLVKLFRTADAYNYFSGSKSYPIGDILEGGNYPMIQKSSRFLRPFERNKILHKFKMKRIKSEMTAAASKNEIYHLWWHPHNFGENPVESLEDLKEILEHYKFCNAEYNFSSLTMDELYTLSTAEKRLHCVRD